MVPPSPCPSHLPLSSNKQDGTSSSSWKHKAQGVGKQPSSSTPARPAAAAKMDQTCIPRQQPPRLSPRSLLGSVCRLVTAWHGGPEARPTDSAQDTSEDRAHPRTPTPQLSASFCQHCRLLPKRTSWSHTQHTCRPNSAAQNLPPGDPTWDGRLQEQCGGPSVMWAFGAGCLMSPSLETPNPTPHWAEPCALCLMDRGSHVQ